jgi:alpha-L-fucosidase 2
MSPFDVNGTFACSVFQQFITNVFNYVLIGAEDAGETDYAFLEDMKEKQSKLDRGAHIGRWVRRRLLPAVVSLVQLTDSLSLPVPLLHSLPLQGQLQEYKLDLDVRNDTHRHISHLIGMYPTSSLATWNETSLARDEIYEAVGTSLYARGNGSADSNTGSFPPFPFLLPSRMYEYQ